MNYVEVGEVEEGPLAIGLENTVDLMYSQPLTGDIDDESSVVSVVSWSRELELVGHGRQWVSVEVGQA